MQQIEDQHRNLGVGQEERPDVALRQIGCHGGIVGEVAVVDQGFVQTDERMRATGVPDAALGRVAVVADPHMRPHVMQTIGLYDVVSVAHHFERQEVLAVGQHERALVTQRGVIGFVQRVTILVDPFCFQGRAVQPVELVLGSQRFQRAFGALAQSSRTTSGAGVSSPSTGVTGIS